MLNRLFFSVLVLTLTACGESNVTGIGAAPIAVMGSVTYSSSQQAVTSATHATVSVAFQNAAATALQNGSATMSGPPIGVSLSSTGTASCGSIIITGATKSGATLTFNSCTGDGSVSVKTASGAAISSTNESADESNQITFLVANTPPAVTAFVSDAATRTFTATFASRVKTFSLTGTEFTMTANAPCASVPSVAVTQNDSGIGSVVTATVTPTVCVTGNVVNAQLNLTSVQNLGGIAGLSSLTQSYTVQ